MRIFINYLHGAGSVINLMPAPFVHQIGRGIVGRSEMDALRSDWEFVGGHLQDAFDRLIGDHEPSQEEESTQSIGCDSAVNANLTA